MGVLRPDPDDPGVRLIGFRGESSLPKRYLLGDQHTTVVPTGLHRRTGALSTVPPNDLGARGIGVTTSAWSSPTDVFEIYFSELGVPDQSRAVVVLVEDATSGRYQDGWHALDRTPGSRQREEPQGVMSWGSSRVS